MAGTPGIELPSALLESADYEALNEAQRRYLIARLNYCKEVADKAAAAAGDSDATLLDSIDDIELDASSIMGSASDVETTVAPYRVHSSWTFECDRKAMAAYVPSGVASFLASGSVGLGCSSRDAKAWLQRWSEVLDEALGCLTVSASFTEAVVLLIVVDALIALYLVFAATMRFSSAAS
jgi:hypothetical protein